jgi:hypothetical protein
VQMRVGGLRTGTRDQPRWFLSLRPNPARVGTMLCLRSLQRVAPGAWRVCFGTYGSRTAALFGAYRSTGRV